MLLTTDHLAALDQLGGGVFATTLPHVVSERTASVYGALARDGFARRVLETSYCLTAEGEEACHFVAGMLAAGVLHQREAMAPNWRFIDDNVLAAMKAAACNAERVALADAPLLLVRGLAELREDPDELRIYVGLNAYGKAWLELAGRARKRAESAYDAAASVGVTPGTLGSEPLPNLAPV